MSYAIRPSYGGPDLIVRGVDGTLSVDVRDAATGSAASITLSGSTVAVYDAFGNARVSPTAITSASGGVASYSLPAASVPSSLQLGDRWRIIWSIVISGATYTFTREAALVLYAPTMSLVPDDLYARHSDLSGQVPPSQSAVGFTPQINEAWKQIQQSLWDMGRRPWLVVSGGSIRLCHVYLTLSMIYQDFSTQMDQTGRYARFAEDYRKRFDEAWATLRFNYDSDEDGTVDEQRAASPVVHVTLGPNRRNLYAPPLRGVW